MASGLVSDVAEEIIKKLPDLNEGWLIWNIELNLQKTKALHTFQLRMKDYDIYLKHLATEMKLDLSDVKSNVELCGGYRDRWLNRKEKAIQRKLEIYLQLILDSNRLDNPPKFNGKHLRNPEDIPEKATQYHFNIHEYHYELFVDDIIKLCIGYKLGYYN